MRYNLQLQICMAYTYIRTICLLHCTIKIDIQRKKICIESSLNLQPTHFNCAYTQILTYEHWIMANFLIHTFRDLAYIRNWMQKKVVMKKKSEFQWMAGRARARKWEKFVRCYSGGDSERTYYNTRAGTLKLEAFGALNP